MSAYIRNRDSLLKHLPYLFFMLQQRSLFIIISLFSSQLHPRRFPNSKGFTCALGNKFMLDLSCQSKCERHYLTTDTIVKFKAVFRTIQ